MTVIRNLVIPVINRPDLLDACIRSINHQVEMLYVIDNSCGELARTVYEAAGENENVRRVFVLEPWVNLGVAGSWNHAIKALREHPYWLIANADTAFAGDDLRRLAAEVDKPAPEWVGVNGDWRVFGINAATIERIGWFDENFHPIYCEDADYERRCTLGGVNFRYIDGQSTHVGSVSWRSDEAGLRNNARTYARNVSYYISKWGAPPRSGEQHSTPFDRALPLGYWEASIERLRDLDWG